MATSPYRTDKSDGGCGGAHAPRGLRSRSHLTRKALKLNCDSIDRAELFFFYWPHLEKPGIKAGAQPGSCQFFSGILPGIEVRVRIESG